MAELESKVYVVKEDTPPAPAPQRVRRLCVNPQVVMAFSSGIYRVTANSLPSDAVCTGMVIDPTLGCVVLYIESKEFEEVQPYAEIPFLKPPVIRRLEESKKTQEGES